MNLFVLFLVFAGTIFFSMVNNFSPSSSSPVPLVNAEEVTITAADPPSTTASDTEITQLYSCVNDKAEVYAYCVGVSYYAVKLSLHPIAFEAEIDGSVSNSALYESGSTSIAFFNPSGELKYTPTSSFTSLIAVSNPGAIHVYSSSDFVADDTNQVVYVSDGHPLNAGNIYKITNLDVMPTISASFVVTLTGAGDKLPIDMILANDDLYVAFRMDLGRVARVANPSSSAAKYTKTVILSEGSIHFYPCLTKTDDNFLFVLTHAYGIISKLSIGATDEDFALVSTSPALNDFGGFQVGTFTWLLPSPWYFIVVGANSEKFYVFDVDAMEYQSTTFPAPSGARGGVLTSSNNKFAMSSMDEGTLYHYDYSVPVRVAKSRTQTPSPSRSLSWSESTSTSPSSSTSRSVSASGSASTSSSVSHTSSASLSESSSSSESPSASQTQTSSSSASASASASPSASPSPSLSPSPSPSETLSPPPSASGSASRTSSASQSSAVAAAASPISSSFLAFVLSAITGALVVIFYSLDL